MDFKKIFQAPFFQSKTFKIIPWLILGLIILLLIFWLGLMVGLKKANFSSDWSDNYRLNFAGPRAGFGQQFNQDFGNRDFLQPHGTFGQIIKIDGSTLIVKDQNNTEKIIVINDDTIIRDRMQTIKPADLQINDNVIIIGEPAGNGQIEAKLIRLMPSLPNNFPTPIPTTSNQLPIPPVPMGPNGLPLR